MIFKNKKTKPKKLSLTINKPLLPKHKSNVLAKKNVSKDLDKYVKKITKKKKLKSLKGGYY